MTKLIKTASDHAAAMTRFSALMDLDPAPDSPEEQELELLGHLIETYEKKHYDLGLPDPVDAIRFRMEQGGLTRKDLAACLGGASRVSEVLGGKRPLSLPMIRALHQDWGIPAEVLLQEPGRQDVPEALPVDRVLLKQLFQRRWLPDFEGNWKQAVENAEELLRRFFCFGVEADAILALNRQAKGVSDRDNRWPLLAWRTHVLCRAASRTVEEPFDPATISPEFLHRLSGLSVHREDGPRLAVELLEGKGIRVVIEPRLDGTHLDGAALRLPGTGEPVIALTLRYDRVDHFWFCLLHELGHVVLHLADGTTEGFLDNLEGNQRDAFEREADDYAFKALLPEADWQRFLTAGVFDPASVNREAKRLGVHGAILAGRLRRETGDFRLLSRMVNESKVRHIFESARTDKQG